jgi:hypothetical protein
VDKTLSQQNIKCNVIPLIFRIQKQSLYQKPKNINLSKIVIILIISLVNFYNINFP